MSQTVNRAYQSIRLGSTIYCSSSYDHFIDVRWMRHGRRWRYTYWIDGGVIDRNSCPGALKIPAYVMRDINQQLVEMLEAGRVKFYEYNRDGEQRWENLRYHDDQWVPDMIERLKRKPGTGDDQDLEKLPDSAQGFWMSVDGQTVHVLGDPSMSEETAGALANVVRAAVRMLDEKYQKG